MLRSLVSTAIIGALVIAPSVSAMSMDSSMDSSMSMTMSSSTSSRLTFLQKKQLKALKASLKHGEKAAGLERAYRNAMSTRQTLEKAGKRTEIARRNLLRAAAFEAALKAELAAAAEGEAVYVGGAPMIRTRDIVENAVLAPNVTTVVAAVAAAGLVDTLKSEGPFTVFAPTNDAFARLPAGTVETLVMPENKATLTSILTYHVVAGKFTAADLKDGMELTTVQGGKLKVSVRNGHTFINGAMVETPDVISSNGVTHVIDRVMVPGSAQESVSVGGQPMYRTQDIVENALRAPNVTTVVAAVAAAGLVDTLKSDGPFTVFAPDNDAFAKLPAGTVDTLLKPENKSLLTKILTYHVVAGKMVSSSLTDGKVLTTVEGEKLTVRVSASGEISLVDAKGGVSKVKIADVISSNGVTYVIDSVLMPAS